jgi:hypoxanthine phosphoribosyltransferase
LSNHSKADRDAFLSHVREVQESADEIYSAGQVEAAMDRMALEIEQRLVRDNPLVLCVMIGGVVLAGRLLTRLSLPLEVDYVHATRYRGETQGGDLHWVARPTTPIEGRSILLIDDILDGGWTLAAIHDYCREEGAHSVDAAVLLDKVREGKAPYRATFVGLQVPDRYVFGYGMDYKGYLRNAPGIYAVADHG